MCVDLPCGDRSESVTDRPATAGVLGDDPASGIDLFGGAITAAAASGSGKLTASNLSGPTSVRSRAASDDNPAVDGSLSVQHGSHDATASVLKVSSTMLVKNASSGVAEKTSVSSAQRSATKNDDASTA